MQKYGRIKFTIQQLEQQADKLRNQIDELQRQKQGLDEQNQKILSVLAYSDQVVKFLQGSDHSFSNDNDNVKILATIAFTLYILYFRDVGIEKLVYDDDLKKLFVRLSRAFAAGGEESVSIPELKMAVAKTLSVLIAKLDPNKLVKNLIMNEADSCSYLKYMTILSRICQYIYLNWYSYNSRFAPMLRSILYNLIFISTYGIFYF